MKTLLLLLAALAHDEKFSTSVVEVKDREVLWKVNVSMIGLEKVIRLPADVLELTDQDLQDLKAEIVSYLLTCIRLEVNGKLVAPEAGVLVPLKETYVVTGDKYIAHASQQFRFRLAEEVRSVKLSGAFFATIAPRHHATVTVLWGEKSKIYSKFGPFEIDFTRTTIDPTVWSTGWEFLVWGMVHIFIGYDHIAFLLALLLGTQRLKEMLLIVTSFTIAHSVTLLLAALEVLPVPAAVTEALIAASIVYVAVENYFLKEGKHRWILTFCFGLVHGLGFSEVLREKLSESGQRVVPVVSFNLGVELGQIAILLVAYPVLMAIRRAAGESQERRQRWIVWAGSAPIALFGLGWLVERVFNLEFMPL